MDSPVIKISDGQIKGCVMTDYDGDKIYAFRGIPYARPPIGDLRFKAPLPVDPWEGIKDATNNGDKCIQRDYYSKNKGQLEGSENCLHLNVYTKELPGSKCTQLKPVMVWIHGGGFRNGCNRSEMFGPEYLLTQDVVLVMVNYRLGILGFLRIKDPSLEVYGNAGLKDQRLALKWVQKNILVFNGDPTNVTIFGESAGSASVHYHVLSSTSAGLFHKAILQSGTAINVWATEPDEPISLVEFTKFLGKDLKNDQECFNYLKDVAVQDLYLAQEKYTEEKSKTGVLLVFTPVVEEPNETSFITNRPIELIRSGQFANVPLIFGYTRSEGLFFVMDKLLKTAQGLADSSDPPPLEHFIPKRIRQQASPETIKELCNKMKTVYKDDELCVHLLSDFFFIPGIIYSIQHHSQVSKNSIYLYRMDLDDNLNLIKKIIEKLYPSLNINIPGMGHADDQGYIFWNQNIPSPKKGSSAEIAMRRIVKLWTNFAKYGTPTRNETEFNVLWKPVTSDCIYYLDIGPSLTARVNPEPERMKLWEEILDLSEKCFCSMKKNTTT